MTAWYRSCFVFSSFGPLYLLLCVGLAVQHDWAKESLRNANGMGMIASATMFAMSIIVFFKLRSGFSSGSPFRFTVEPLESLDENILSYMLSYFPPLMIDDLSSLSKDAPVIVFYGVLLLILIRTKRIYINPYFLLFSYRIFRVKLPSGRGIVLITRKQEIRQGEMLTLFEIQPSALFYAT